MKRTILIQNICPTDEETSSYSEETIKNMGFCAIKEMDLDLDMKDVTVILEKETEEG